MGEADDLAIGVYLEAVSNRDEEAAHSVVVELMRAGSDAVAVIDDVIAPALHSVGEMWDTGAWTVAQEHIATEISERVIASMIADHALPGPATGIALIACAEGEWHSLPSRAVQMGFVAAGWRTRLLGPSVSASQLATAIYDEGPDIVAVSCCLAANVPGARRMILAARETGTPVLVGGSAFGRNEARARLLGANGWGPNAASAAEVAAAILGDTTNASVLVPTLEAETTLLGASQREIVHALSRALDPEGSLDGELASGGVWLLRTLHAALLVNDVGVVVDQLRWQSRRASLGKALPVGQITDALLGALPGEAERARRLLLEARTVAEAPA